MVLVTDVIILYSGYFHQMGMRTTHWGPFFWYLIHTIAFYSDALGSYLPGRWEGIFLLLPCSHCRACAASFLMEYNGVLTTNYNQTLVYLLHEHVNIKLMTQELNAKLSPRDDILRRWYGYQPTLQSMLAWVPTTEDFLCSFAMVLFYVAYDRDVNMDALLALFPAISPLRVSRDQPEDRVRDLWFYIQHIYKRYSLVDKLPALDTILDHCKYAQVVCR